MPARWMKVWLFRRKAAHGRRWVAQWREGGRVRERVVPKRHARRAANRERFRAHLEDVLNGMREPGAEPVTLQAAVAEFLASREAKGLRPRSIETYRQILRRLGRTVKRRLLRDVGRRDLVAYLAGRQIGAVTRLREWTHLQVFFRWAGRVGYIEADRMAQVDRPLATLPTPFAYTAEEAGRIIDAARGCRPWVNAACRLALIGGLRAGELAAVAAEHVDWRRGTLRVPAQKSARERSVGLDAETLGLLHDLRYRADRMLWGGPEAPFATEFTFRRYLVAEVRAICSKAGVPKPAKPIHDLRRTCATLMADAGVPAFALGQVMGHRSVATTAAYYLAPDGRRAAVQGLQAVQNSVPGLVRRGELLGIALDAPPEQG